MTDVPLYIHHYVLLYVHCYSHTLTYMVPLSLVAYGSHCLNPCPAYALPTPKPIPCIQALKEAMLYFSQSKPNLVMVIPAMDYINEIFTTGLLNDKRLDPAIRTAIGLAKTTLN